MKDMYVICRTYDGKYLGDTRYVTYLEDARLFRSKEEAEDHVDEFCEYVKSVKNISSLILLVKLANCFTTCRDRLL